MAKDFSKWFKKKPEIDTDGRRPILHERDVWWCYLGKNIGSEEDGKGYNISRPVIVFRRFNRNVCWIIPLTTKEKTDAFHLAVDLGDGIRRFASLRQLRLIDAKRLYWHIDSVDRKTFSLITLVMSQIAGPDWELKKSRATLL